MSQNWVRGAKITLAYTLAYVVVVLALNRFAFSDGWTIVWPLNGINIALLLVRPRSSWPWMLAGIELGTGIGDYLDDPHVHYEAAQRLLSALEVVVSASLLPRFEGMECWLRTPHINPRYIAAVLVGPGISGLLAAVLFHWGMNQPFLLAFNNWATADAVGIVAFMPLAMTVTTAQFRALFARQELPRTMGTLILAFAGAELVFSVSTIPLLWVLFPLLLLADSLLAFEGAAVAVAGVVLIAVYFTTQHLGPFGRWPDDSLVPRDLALQIFLGFQLVALFPASLMMMERRRMARELAATNARLTVLASLDGLTGVANRRSFDERLTQEWSRATRYRKPLALAMIDLDNFKQFNDLYGHVAGDRCLCAVAETLRREVQRPEDLVARFGGEEFALLLPHTSAEGAVKVVERIRAAVHALAIDHIGNSWNRVTVSIGFSALIPTQSESQSRLIQLADAALYQAKSGGRNRCESISSIEGAQAAANLSSTTARNRIVRILGRGG